MRSHVHQDSDEIEERVLGEFAAANQVDQERRWSQHAAMSREPENHSAYHYISHPQSSTIASRSPVYESALREDMYMSSYHSSVPHAYYPELRPFSVDPRDDFEGHLRQSFPPSDGSLTSTSTRVPNSIFQVRAAHHMPVVQARPEAYTEQIAMQNSSTQMGDPLPGFPRWSRSWYNGHLSADGHAYTMVAPSSGKSGWESESFGRYPYRISPYLDERANNALREERIVMLEKEFKPQISHRDSAGGEEKWVSKTMPSKGIDEKGRLVLPARKLCIATRWFQCLLSAAAAGCGIGGFVLIHPTIKALPSGTLPSFALYGVSAVSTLVCIWLFLLRPCCTGKRQYSNVSAFEDRSQGMVIPITTGGSSSKKKGKSQPGAVVNVILDPTMFRQSAEESDSDLDADSCVLSERQRKNKRKRQSRIGLIAKLQAQGQWNAARHALKWECTCDVVLCLLWAAAAVLALGFGEYCPVGSAQGWCDLYNGAIACAVLTVGTCMIAIYCDFVRLKACKNALTAM